MDLRFRPAAPAPAASGNLGFFPLGIEVKKHGFPTAWLITGQELQGRGLKLTAFILTFRDPSSHFFKKPESGCFDGFGVGELLQDLGFFKPIFLLRQFETSLAGIFKTRFILREFE